VADDSLAVSPPRKRLVNIQDPPAVCHVRIPDKGWVAFLPVVEVAVLGGPIVPCGVDTILAGDSPGEPTPCKRLVLWSFNAVGGRTQVV